MGFNCGIVSHLMLANPHYLMRQKPLPQMRPIIGCTIGYTGPWLPDLRLAQILSWQISRGYSHLRIYGYCRSGERRLTGRRASNQFLANIREVDAIIHAFLF